MRSFLSAIQGLGGETDTLDAVLDAIDYGVFVDHVENGCIYANAEILRMFDIDWEAFAGFGWAHSVLPEDMEILREAIERYEHEKTWIEVEYRIKRPSGEIRHIRVIGKAVLDGQGKQLGSVILGRDVTQERKLEERSAETQKLEAIGRLAGRVAHDFNNVLTPILISTALLEEELVSEDAQELLQTIHRSVDHATAITRQLLGLSRQHVYEQTTSKLDAEIMGLKTLLTQLLGETIELRLNLQTGDRCVAWAPHELGQVVLNLAVNARDAMNGKGRIAIGTRTEGNRVRLTVEDGGPGISVEVQRRMFEPFYTTKPEGRGTGLGLSTVRDLVQRAGGAIEVDSQLGRGTRMEVVVPDVDGTAAHRSGSTALLDVPPMRVLLVEDDSALRQTLAYVLALRRHKVKTAAGCVRALEMLKEEEFDVVVSDLLMPDGTGAELIATARKARPDLRVIFMSGFAGEAHDQLDLDAPSTVFLQKPFHPNQLMEALAEVLQEREEDRSA